MTKEEKWQWVMEQCGVKVIRAADGYLMMKNAKGHTSWIDPDLNTLFKYVAPKLYTCELSKDGRPDHYGLWFAYVRLTDRLGKAVQAEDKDPADALFWACYKAFGGEGSAER